MNLMVLDIYTEFFFHVLAVLFGICVLVLFTRVSKLKKPPGSLILGQIIVLILFRASFVAIYVIIFLSADYILSAIFIFQFVVDCCMVVTTAYGLFIAIELYLKAKGRRMGSRYRRRTVFYHIIAPILGIAIQLLVSESWSLIPDNNLSLEEVIVLEYIFPILFILTSLLLLLFTACRMRRRRTGPKKQFLKYVAGYLSIFCLTKLIFILTSNSLVLMIWGDFDMINTHFYDAVLYLNALMTTFSEPAVFLSILYELNTLAYLRDRFKKNKTVTVIRQNAPHTRHELEEEDSQQLLINNRRDEREVRVLELEIASISMIMSKSTEYTTSLNTEFE
jgi:hypothetical protein